MSENEIYHMTHCAFCGKGVFWARIFRRLVELGNGWVAHKKCWEKWKRGEEFE